MKRKLTTVFCADAHNYGQMMARDESETLDRLRRYREIMDGLFARHDGRKVNTWGDAVIAEFPSVVEAVRCAVEIQDAIGAENRDLPGASQMWFRIGINLGDVMEDSGDIYGDGVNVASRLEALADPGGVMVSRSVYEFAHRQLAIGFDFAGELNAKAGEAPISGYRVRVGGSNAHKPSDPPVARPAPEASVWRKLEARFERFRGWFDLQSRPVQICVFAIGFFFAVNLLFDSIARPWFVFPSAPFAFYIWLRMRDAGEG